MQTLSQEIHITGIFPISTLLQRLQNVAARQVIVAFYIVPNESMVLTEQSIYISL